jgi:2-methylisocitrate lyase-like PEP mutase family enzyme
MDLRPTSLLPDGYRVPATRWDNQSTRLRHMMDNQPYVFGPGIFDPHGAELVMYFGFCLLYTF